MNRHQPLSASPKKIAFIGLGVMGYPMAGHLARAGYALTVYNRTQAIAERWVKAHAEAAGTVASATLPRDAASDCDFVMVCVGNDDDVRSVTHGPDGAIAGLKTGAVLIDHTTASAKLARELDTLCRAHEAGFIDAPVSGGQAGAENGQLTVMCGGSDEDFASAERVMDAYAKATTLLGPAGAGQLTKMVNQICIAGLVQGLAEGLHFAQTVGLDAKQVISAISKGAAQSWQMENRSSTMVDGKFDYGFAVEWMRKDLSIALDQAKVSGARLPVTALVDQFYADVEAMGGSRWDTSSLICRLSAANDD